MKQDKKQEKRSVWSIIIAAIYGIAAVAFVLALLLLDLLPLGYLVLVVVLMGLISAVLVRGLLFSKHHGKKHIASAVIASILALCLLAGTSMLAGTMSFFNNILAGSQSYEYYVVVRSDSSYEEIEDIANETVSVLNVQNTVQESAKEELQKDVAVVFKTEDELSSMTTALMNRETNILLLDEPTNHLDVDAKEELKRALKEYKGAVLLICHEPEFYDGLVSKVWDLSKWSLKI